MPSIETAATRGDVRAAAAAGGTLATLCYRSRACGRQSTEDLDQLLASARARNARFGVTGMLVHEGDRFFQWLEGPSAAINVLWTSISRDDRHADVELLGEGLTPARLFRDWNLRFVERTAPEQGAQPGVAPAEAEAAEPEAGPIVLARLALAGDEEGMAELVRQRAAGGEDASLLCRNLFEPAAHQLGDWWCEDVCSSFDITLALGRLQSLVRRSDMARPKLRRVAIEGRSILVSPPPRETHMLGATLLGGFFARAGWSVQAEFPQEDPELIGLVSTHWFDALALTLSDVFTRRDRLAALIETIKDVRRASQNPKMAVIVGGRAFRPAEGQAAEQVGADVHYASAGQAVGDLQYWLFMHRFRRDGSVDESGRDESPLTPLDLVQTITPALKLIGQRRAAPPPS